MVGLLPQLQEDGACAAWLRQTPSTPSTRESRARESQGRFTQDFDDFLAVPGCASGPHWTGEGDPPQVEEIISMSEEGFDLG
jgi:hypothetical protein